VSARPKWSYVQARLQARHGDRLNEDEWHVLEAAKSIEQFIERSRATSLRRFTDRLHGRMSSDLIERLLRDAWRAYVAEVGAWVPQSWRPSVLWISYIPDLPVLDALLKGESPVWARADAVYVKFTEGDARRSAAALERSPLAPLAAANGGESTLAERWAIHWQSRWPGNRPADHRSLLDLLQRVKNHVERLRHADAQETSNPYRRDLAQAVTRIFRRRSETPVAVFCHLALVALDLERLRGGLVRRRLFEPSHAVGTA
jgi:hypothetical protein